MVGPSLEIFLKTGPEMNAFVVIGIIKA